MAFGVSIGRWAVYRLWWILLRLRIFIHFDSLYPLNIATRRWVFHYDIRIHLIPSLYHIIHALIINMRFTKGKVAAKRQHHVISLGAVQQSFNLIPQLAQPFISIIVLILFIPKYRSIRIFVYEILLKALRPAISFSACWHFYLN